MVKDENGDTMSKSKGNVVPPSSVIEPYGADTMRLAILFIAPPEKDFDWDPKAVEGANRFIKRAWRIVWQLVQSGDANVAFDKSALDEVAMKLYRERHRTIAKCTEDFDRGQFNTAISAVMELVNAASAYLNATEGADRDKALCYGVAKDIVSVLAPICRSGPTSCGTRRSAARATPTPPPGPSSTWPSPSRTRCRSSSRYSARSVAALTLPAMPPTRRCSCRRAAVAKWTEARRSSRPSACPASWSTWWSSKHCALS